LLGDIAAQVQLDSQKLGDLWATASTKTPAHNAPPATQHGDWQPDDYSDDSPTANTWSHPLDGKNPDAWKTKRKWEGKGEWKGKGKWERDRQFRPPLRGPLATRADHAVRILLAHSDLWESLSNEDHALLCELPAPHGPLIAWLEAQLHEHGPLAWGALRDELLGKEGEELALRLMADPTVGAGTSVEGSSESGAELRDLVNRMLIERIKEQETQAIADMQTDPAARSRYLELCSRRKQIELAIRPAA
jgi:DNA primase